MPQRPLLSSIPLSILMYPFSPQLSPHEFFTIQYLVPSRVAPYPTSPTPWSSSVPQSPVNTPCNNIRCQFNNLHYLAEMYSYLGVELEPHAAGFDGDGHRLVRHGLRECGLVVGGHVLVPVNRDHRRFLQNQRICDKGVVKYVNRFSLVESHG